MCEKEALKERCLNELEAALLEYVQSYGPTAKARVAISRLAIARAAFGKEFGT